MRTPERSNSDRARAWRNTMIAAINAGLEQKLFGLQPGQDYWAGDKDPEERSHRVFEFSVNDIPGLGYVRAIGWDELDVHSVLWPTAKARRWIVCGNIANHWHGPHIGDVIACGWFERRTERYLMPSTSLFYCRAARKPIVVRLAVVPQGFKDHGHFIF